MTTAEQTAPKVFISYSHDSPEHADRVLALANSLVTHGVDVSLDQYDPNPAEGWPLWMQNALNEADFVLLVCTDTYDRRARRREEPGRGLGVKWEGTLIYNRLYDNPSQGKRYLPIVFDAKDASFVPDPLRGFTRYHLQQFDLSDEQYIRLLHHLTSQPATLKPPLGARPILEPHTPSPQNVNPTKPPR